MRTLQRYGIGSIDEAALGAGIVGENLALGIVDTFLGTEFSGEERHQRRVNLIEQP